MFESFRFFVPRDGHDNGSAKDGGGESYLFRPQLGYGLKCEEKHENWKVEPYSPWITPIRGSIFPLTQRQWPPASQGTGMITTVPGPRQTLCCIYLLPCFG
uniref:Uncharacterized protein n=1 Tax=Bionectria ochroleuca TaxID=29856 RepID=A0A8H7N2Z9_BIOOC